MSQGFTTAGGVTNFVHIGLVVEDLDETVRFLTLRGYVAFNVDDVRGVVDRLRDAGWETVGEIVDYENTYLLCYVRGPEGLIVELAERIRGSHNDMTAAANVAAQAPSDRE